jgi:hypothetical protein
MTTHVATVAGSLGTSLGIPIAHTYTPVSTAQHVGTLTSEQCVFVKNVTVALRCFLLSGETSSDDIWEIQITRRPKGLLGKQENIPKQSEKK